MTILTISKNGTLRLPKEIVGHFKGAKHVKVKLGTNIVSLSGVEIQYAGDIRAIPPAQPTRTAQAPASALFGK